MLEKTEDGRDARFYRAVHKALLYIRVLQVLQVSQSEHLNQKATRTKRASLHTKGTETGLL